MSQANLQGSALANFIDDDEDDSSSAGSSPNLSRSGGRGAGIGAAMVDDNPAMAKAIKCFTPVRLLVVFTIVNVLNYVDRGIVSGAGTSIKGCNATCTSAEEFCWDNITQRSCGEHYFRKFCSARGETCQLQFSQDVPMCDAGYAASINDTACQDPTNLTACPACCNTQYGFSINEEQLGWLQFAFLIGYMPSMLIFGHLVQNHKPFTLMGAGLTIWCCAVLASGFSGPHFFDSYIMMLIARAVSGVGEASFQCIGPPFIDDYAPKAQKGVWLAIFYSAIPCGTALGFVWAGEIAKALSWEYAFIIECPIMLPMAIMCFFIPLDLKSKGIGHGHGAALDDDADDARTGIGGGGDDDVLSTHSLEVDHGSHGLGRMSSARLAGSINDAPGGGAGDSGAGDSGSGGSGGEEILLGFGARGARDVEDDEASYDPYGGVSLGDDDNDLREGLVDNIYSSKGRGGGGKKGRSAKGGKDVSVKHSMTLWDEILPVIRVPTFLLVTFGYAAYSAVTAGFAFYGPTYVQENFCTFTQSSADLVFGGVIVVTGMVGTPLGGWVFDMKVCSQEGAPKPTQGEKTLKALWHMAAEVGVGTAFCIAAVYVTGAVPFFALLAIGCVFIFMTTSAVNIATMWSVPPENRPFAIAISTILIHLLGDVPSPVIIGLLDDSYTPTIALLCTSVWLVWSVVCWGAAWVVWKMHLRSVANKVATSV